MEESETKSMIMQIRFTKHAIERMREREIPEELVRFALEQPDSIAADFESQFVAKKLHFTFNKPHLLLIFYKEIGWMEVEVVTLVDTSKVDKYS